MAGFAGIELSTFVAQLLYELAIVMAPDNNMYLHNIYEPLGDHVIDFASLFGIVGQTKTAEKDHGAANMTKSKSYKRCEVTVPFLSPPNMSWPVFLPGALNLDNFVRTRNNANIDFRTGNGVLTGECKDHSRELKHSCMMSVLEKIPPTSLVHIVVTNYMQKSNFQKEKFSEYRKGKWFENAWIAQIVRGESEFRPIIGMENKCTDKVCNCKEVERLVLFVVMKTRGERKDPKWETLEHPTRTSDRISERTRAKFSIY